MHFTVKIAAVLLLVGTAAAQEKRFSRLLTTQPDLLKFTTISNLNPSSTDLEKQFQAFYNPEDVSQSPTRKPMEISGAQQFAPRMGETGGEYFDGTRVITKPQPGDEYVHISSVIKQGSGDSLTSINQKPVGRKQLRVLQQSSGNTLNFSPVFHEAAPRRLATTSTTPIPPPKYEEEYFDEATTVNSAGEEEVEEAITYAPPTQEKRQRMIVNVVTSEPRSVTQDAATTPAATTAATTTSTTPKPKKTTTVAPQEHENLVVEAFHRKGHFPDFEDSPANLHASETNSPARVNVRPSSNGNEYEYEYIYYYYDDDDENNGTDKKPADASSSSSAGVQDVKVGEAVPETSSSFEAGKVGVGHPPLNSLESGRDAKAFETASPQSVEVPQQSPEVHEEITATTVQPELQRPFKPKSILLKQSGLVPSAAAPVEQPAPPTTTTTTSTAAPAPETPRSRFRPKHRGDKPTFNRPVETEVEPSTAAPVAPRRRPNFRRPQASVEPEQAAAQEPIQEAPRAPAAPRTRFPPRVTTESSVEAAAAPVAVQAPKLSAPAQSVESKDAVIDASKESKSRDNFARQKSITDLYALTRLHQLAINTRVPNPNNRPRPTFATSAEQTTQEINTGSSEVTTTSPIILSEIAPVATEQVPTPTAAKPSEAAPTPAEVPAFGKQRRFRPRQRNPVAPETASVAPTTESSTRGPNRFGRRRPFAPSSTAQTNVEQPQNDNAVEPSAPPSARPAAPQRIPARNRFQGRTRPTTTTTEASADANGAEQQDYTPVRRRPSNFAGRRRPQQLQQQPAAAEGAREAAPAPATSEAPVVATSARSNSESERRRFNFGNPARNRPSGPRALLRGRQPTTEAPSQEPPQEVEHKEPIVSEHVSVSESESPAAEKPAEQGEEGSFVVSVSSTTTSSVSSDVGPAKKGSAAVLGRLRNRSKPILTTTTTPAPEAKKAVERKPSRLNGILNRRKPASPAPPSEAPHQEPEHEQEHSEQHEEQPQKEELPKGVVVQISTTVTESEEVGEHHDEVSSTTHASILNRLKSQRKPGTLNRKPTTPKTTETK